MTLAQIQSRLAADGLLKSAQVRADRGIKSSAQHAEQDAPGWQDDAMHYLRWYTRLMARRTCNQFHIEAFRQWAASKGLKQPDELRSYGALTRRAIAEGVITPTGLYARAVSSNLSPKMIYQPVDQRTVR